MSVDWTSFGEGIGGSVVGAVMYVRGRVTGRAKARDTTLEEMHTELRMCRRDKQELRDKLSAMETELVVLRKLLPGGEWYKKLGLSDDPH